MRTFINVQDIGPLEKAMACLFLFIYCYRFVVENTMVLSVLRPR